MASRKGRRADGTITTRTVPDDELAADSARDTAAAAEVARLARIQALLTSLPGDATLPEVVDKVNAIIKALRAQFYAEDGR